MRRHMTAAFLVAASLLPQVATARPKSTVDLAPVAAHAAQAIKAKLPPAATVVTVRPLRAQLKRDTFGPLLEGALRATGFAVSNDPTTPGVQSVGYDVAPLGGEVLLRLAVAGEDTARLLRPTDNGTVALAGPVAVRETD